MMDEPSLRFVLRFGTERYIPGFFLQLLKLSYSNKVPKLSYILRNDYLITIRLDVCASFLYKKIHSIEYLMAHAPRYYFLQTLSHHHHHHHHLIRVKEEEEAKIKLGCRDNVGSIRPRSKGHPQRPVNRTRFAPRESMRLPAVVIVKVCQDCER